MGPYAVRAGRSTGRRVFARLFSAPSLRVLVCLLTLAFISSTTLFAQYSGGQYRPESEEDQLQQPYGDQPSGNNAGPGAQASEAPLQSYANVQPLGEAQLEQLVAPIALYPDILVAQVLTASTYPQQVSDADQWRRSQGYGPPNQIVAGADAQNWDPSVKALTAFPQVLAQMACNLRWTTDLGNAYYNQPEDVLHSIQVMRWRARDAGNLRNTPQEALDYQLGNIVLAPPNPQVVYVPEYNPWAVYGAPVAPYPGFSVLAAVGSFIGNVAIRFGWGIATTAFAHSPFGLLAWGLDWLAHAVLFNGSTYYSHSTTVRDWGLPHGGPRAFSRGDTFAARSNRPFRRGDGFESGNGGFRNSLPQQSNRTHAYGERNRDLYGVSRAENYRGWKGSRGNYASSSDEGFRSFRRAPNRPERDTRGNYNSVLNNRGSYSQDLYRQENGRQNHEFRSSGYTGEVQANRASHASLARNFSKHSDKTDNFSRSFAKNNHFAERFSRSRESKQSHSEKRFASAKSFGKSHFSQHSHSGGHGHGGKHHG